MKNFLYSTCKESDTKVKIHPQLNLKTGHDPTKGEIKDNTLNCQKQLDISLTFGIN
jgi:hypothetical protein